MNNPRFRFAATGVVVAVLAACGELSAPATGPDGPGGVFPDCVVPGGAGADVSVDPDPPTELRLEATCRAGAELASVRIVFARATPGSVQGRTSSLVVMNADGSGTERLTDAGFNDSGPDVSPDGSEILFMRDEPDGEFTPAIHLRTPEGEVMKVVPEPAYDPDWSPDGESFAFIGPAGHWGGPVTIARRDGSSAIRLTGQDPMLKEASPAWSPDGTRLAFMRAELGTGPARVAIWRMNADGSLATPLTRPATRPAWAPDGERIAFSDFDGYDEGRVVLVNADGSGALTLLTVTGVSRLLVEDWSTDGRFLLFSASPRPSVRSDICLFEIATGAAVRLTNDGAFNTDAVFWNEKPRR